MFKVHTVIQFVVAIVAVDVSVAMLGDSFEVDGMTAVECADDRSVSVDVDRVLAAVDGDAQLIEPTTGSDGLLLLFTSAGSARASGADGSQVGGALDEVVSRPPHSKLLLMILDGVWLSAAAGWVADWPDRQNDVNSGEVELDAGATERRSDEADRQGEMLG